MKKKIKENYKKNTHTYKKHKRPTKLKRVLFLQEFYLSMFLKTQIVI